MRRITAYAAAAALCCASFSTLAGDAAAGKSKSSVCAGCHGPNGMSSVPMYPNLAGQKEEYLVKALKAYKAGERGDATMKAMAAPLSEDDIANLAAYYASLSCK